MVTTGPAILAVVAGVESSSHVVEAAIERVEQERSPLVVLHVMPAHVYERKQRSVTRSPDLAYDGFTFTRTQAVDAAREVADRAVRAIVGDREIQYTAVGRVGGLLSTVLAVAATHGCETIFVPETESWFRRVVGRADHKLAKRFDGTVVRVPRPPPPNLKTTRPLPEG